MMDAVTKMHRKFPIQSQKWHDKRPKLKQFVGVPWSITLSNYHIVRDYKLDVTNYRTPDVRVLGRYRKQWRGRRMTSHSRHTSDPGQPVIWQPAARHYRQITLRCHPANTLLYGLSNKHTHLTEWLTVSYSINGRACHIIPSNQMKVKIYSAQ